MYNTLTRDKQSVGVKIYNFSKTSAGILENNKNL